jgi:ribonuclease E
VEGNGADTLTPLEPIAAEVALASDGPIVTAVDAAEPNVQPSAQWPFPAPTVNEPVTQPLAAAPAEPVPAPAPEPVAVVTPPVQAAAPPSVQALAPPTMPASAPPVMQAVAPPAVPAAVAPAVDLDQALRESGLVLIETDRARVDVSPAATEAVPMPRARRERRPPPAGLDEPMVQVETKP